MGCRHLTLAESSDTLLIQQFLQIRRKRLLYFLKTHLLGLRFLDILRRGLLGRGGNTILRLRLRFVTLHNLLTT